MSETTGASALHVDEDLSTVPSVLETPKKKAGWKGIVAVAGAVLAVVCIGVFILTRVVGAKVASVQPKKADPGEKATAAAAAAPGAARTFSAEAPVRPAIAQFPAADAPGGAASAPSGASASPNTARPIELRADGTPANRPQGNGQPARHPDDGPVMLALAPRGVAGAPGAASQARSTSAGSPGLVPVSATAEDTSSGRAAPGRSAPGGNSEYAQLQQSLQTTQQNLNQMLSKLVNSQQQQQDQLAAPGTPALSGGVVPQGAAAPAGQRQGLFGGQLQSSQTEPVSARMLGNLSLTMPRGTAFTCALRTKVISATSGMVSCTVLRNVYSADGRTVLVDRGSQLDGEYRIVQVRPGVTRIPTIWQRVRTPSGVIVDLESPATGPLGESGLGGYVDNRWLERIGAALLVGFLDDAFKYAIASAADGKENSTIVLNSTSQQAQQLPEKILDSTINIPPTITANQGALVGIYVARDVDFSSVYALRAER